MQNENENESSVIDEGTKSDDTTTVSTDEKVVAAINAIELVGDSAAGDLPNVASDPNRDESASNAVGGTIDDQSGADKDPEPTKDAGRGNSPIISHVDEFPFVAKTSGDFPPEPDLNKADDATAAVVHEHKPFPPEPRLGQRRPVWANGRQYGSSMAAATALGITEEVLAARIASSEENYSSYHWAD